MEVSKILRADLLDILFEGRNKDYGAYELRRQYNKRLTLALIITASLAALILLISLIPKKEAEVVVAPKIEEVELINIEQEEKVEPPPPPPPPAAKIEEPPKVETVKYTPPKIVKDEEVREDEKPPKQEEVAEAKIGVVNQEGIKDYDGIIAPPSDHGDGVSAGPVRAEEDWDKVFNKVEIESKYPGGNEAWRRFLQRNMRYPDRAAEDNIQGTVVIQFIVDKEGNVSEVTAVEGTHLGGGLVEEAIRIIKRSGKWEPAIQNGRKVKSYKKQPITFKLG
ncbi:MAG TPA: TonB family protein [Parasegetibacter sp.]